MPMHPHPTSFGVFKPVDHIMMSFASTAQSDGAVAALHGAGFSDADLSRYSAAEMQTQAEQDIVNASALASMGQDLNLVKAHLALALEGQNFVVVSAQNDDQVQRVTQVAVQWQATRAQRYGTLIVEELVAPGTSQQQTAESPARGLDQQAPARMDVLGPEADA
jgi:hypothetical protein